MSGKITDNIGKSSGLIKAAGGGKTVKRHYFSMATRTAGNTSVADQYTITSGFTPTDPSVNDFFVQWIAPADGSGQSWTNVGLRFNDGSTDYDYPVGNLIGGEHQEAMVLGGNINIAAGVLGAGTYTVVVRAYYANATVQFFNPNSSDDAKVSTQMYTTLMITEYKN
jgi:hypothetical protein